ncbi:MAG: hypothetical protein ACK53A_09575 [Gemmatimonadota bacterium]|jgi:hypothetical protein|nr:hypothetical protein [Gemmatimonadota bacterium]
MEAPRLSSESRVAGAAVLYRLYDIGWEIDLARAEELLRSRAPARARPERGEGATLRIPNPPVTVGLGTERLELADGSSHDVEVSARLFDFGVASLRLSVPVPSGATWAAFTQFGRALHAAPAAIALLDDHRRLLAERIAGAVERPHVAPVIEDYIVFRLHAVTSPDGTLCPPAALADDALVPLLLDESRPLSEAARRELLPHRFSYYADDLAVVTWDNALVLEPSRDDDTVSYILEFANAQLLELRWYDSRLEAELQAVLERSARARGRGISRLFTRRYGDLLEDLQQLVGDATEITERVDNALKVTDDVYLARIYGAALEVFRGKAWRAGVDRKVAILRETYAMLNAETQTTRGELLEVAIVVLILAEIGLALVR